MAAISSLYNVPSPLRADVWPAVQLHNMALEPALHRQGIGRAVMVEILRRLRATDTALLWASARDSALPFYERFGFRVVEVSGFVAQAGCPHHLIELDLSGGPAYAAFCRRLPMYRKAGAG